MKNESKLAELIEAADAAYRDVRVHVISCLAPPARVDLTQLTLEQHAALLALEQAETELTLYREDTYLAH
jgi:hypothetical protein